MSRSELAMACEDYDEDGCAWSRREAARIKQIQIGKARPEYLRYVREVLPSRRTPSQPSTPDPRARVSKRQFDRALGDWRRRLHEFDAVPRGAPRAQEAEAASWSWNGSSPAKKSSAADAKWLADVARPGLEGTIAQSTQQTDSGRNGPRSGRRARATPVPPRSGKCGPRKPLDSDLSCKDVQSLADSNMPPPPPANPAAAAGSVVISLADGLIPVVENSWTASSDCFWYQSTEAPWGNMETPEKSAMMFMGMEMETPPDKPLMPVTQPMFGDTYDLKVPVNETYMMPMDYSAVLPHRLFDSSPEKSEQTHREATVEGGECPSQEVPEPQSPRQADIMPLMSPPLHCLASPVPTTPKRQCYVPETPSPDRMHCSWMQQPPLPYGNPMPMAGSMAGPMPTMWYSGQVQVHEQVVPEFMPMMPCLAHADGTPFGDVQQMAMPQ